MNYMKIYQDWINDPFFDEQIRAELCTLKDKEEIEDRFYCDLDFGTGGLRGVMGAGTNRMNRYTVAKATFGLGRYLLENYGNSSCKEHGAVISFDTRNGSRLFAETVANVLSAMGIKAYLQKNARPTPQLSFLIRHLGCIGGVMITASHNPKEYNGYKVYDPYGCQLVPRQAKQLITYINKIDDYHVIPFQGNNRLIETIDGTDAFVDAVLIQSRYQDKNAKANLSIVYTPLHGTGNTPVRKTLAMDGFAHVDVVPEQDNKNGDFPTVCCPNPEDRLALELGIARAKRCGADIVLGTDPDCDRVGIAVKDTDESYHLMTGNQVGALLTDYVLRNTDLHRLSHPAIVKTVVTSELGIKIAQKYGLTVFSTLTGFKYIGEKITQFERAKTEQNACQDYDFVLGYEESYGYLVGTHARDKDAVVSSMLICEMAAEAKQEGKTLLHRMRELYAEYGFYRDALDSFTFKGKEGLQHISSIMSALRNGLSIFNDVTQVIDYSQPVEAEKGFGQLPTSNVLKYILSDGSWVAVRPSGTEPKIKLYYSVRAENEKAAEQRLRLIAKTIRDQLELN